MMTERIEQLGLGTPSTTGPLPNPPPAYRERGSEAEPTTIRLAVFISGGGTTLQNLIDRVADKRLVATIGLVVSSKASAYGVDRAKEAGLPTVVAERKDFDSVEAFSDNIFAACEAAGVNLVCLAGWLQLLRLPPAWAGRVINIHPALLPKYGGKNMYGRRVHEAVLAGGDRASGCTVHFVNNEYDAGPVLLQARCPVRVGDTAETLAERVFASECEAYPRAITAIAKGDVRLDGGQVVWR